MKNIGTTVNTRLLIVAFCFFVFQGNIIPKLWAQVATTPVLTDISFKNSTPDGYINKTSEIQWTDIDGPDSHCFNYFYIFNDIDGNGFQNTGSGYSLIPSFTFYNPDYIANDIDYNQPTIEQLNAIAKSLIIRGRSGPEEAMLNLNKTAVSGSQQCTFQDISTTSCTTICLVGVIGLGYIDSNHDGSGGSDGPGRKYYFWNMRFNSPFIKKIYIIDPVAPVPSVLSAEGARYAIANNISAYYEKTRNITVKWAPFTDVGSGINDYKVYENAIEIIPSLTATSFPVNKNVDGTYRYSVVGYDRVGNSCQSDLITVIVDTSAPSVQIRPPTGYISHLVNKPYYYNNNVLLEVNPSTDINLNDSSYTWSTKKDNETSWTPVNSGTNTNYSFATEGKYAVRCSVEDYAGNIGYSDPINIFIDKTPPLVMAKPNLSFAADSGGTICGLNVGWNAGDDGVLGSGIKDYTIYYRTAKVTDEYSGFNTITSITSMVDTIDISLLHRDATQKIQVAIIAIDVFGNKRAPDWDNSSEIILPAIVESGTITSELDDSVNPTIVVNIPLNITKERAIADYSRLTFIRASVPGNTALPGDDLLPKTFVVNNNAFNTFQVDTNGHLVIKDIISSSTSAGHKYIQYSISGTPKSAPLSKEYRTSTKIMLPNNPGSITWKLIDVNGNKLFIDSDGNELVVDSDGNPIANSEFKIYIDGKVNVSFIGNDLDQEPWAIELDHTQKIFETPEIISSVRISGVNTTPYDTNIANRNEVIFPVTLAYGTNTLLFMWEEGTLSLDDNIIKNQSEILNIELGTPKFGENFYSLHITDEYTKYDGSGITVHPGQPLTIEVASEDTENIPSYDWDFGDNTYENSKSIKHQYIQRPETEQKTDTTIYYLSLKITEKVPPYTVTSIDVPVNVKDTQQGELFMSEVWRGLHTITGVVVVTSGKTLTIGSAALNSDMTVQSSGGVGAGYMQGIKVQSGAELIVNNDGKTVSFTDTPDATTEAHRGWGTVYIDNGGKATISDSVFEYADRALTAVSGSFVDIDKSIFNKNKIGLHIFGRSTVTVNNSTISDNTVYGVKEEKGTAPIVSENRIPKLNGNRIFNNFRDYYSYDLGLISFDKLNATPNSGNQGE